jgi:hypothetical protein
MEEEVLEKNNKGIRNFRSKSPGRVTPKKVKTREGF